MFNIRPLDVIDINESGLCLTPIAYKAVGA